MFPRSEAELLTKANELAGKRLSDVAHQLSISVPHNLTRHKGWVGNLFEIYLGASAGSKPERDFQHLGIELKTLPLNKNGEPQETTFVCVAPLLENQGVTWETSHVRYKLSKVLWIPIEAERSIAIGERRIGYPILWSPSKEQEQQLKQDWQELMDMIVLGNVKQITARMGEYLQIRPKAANGKSLTEAINAQGKIIKTRPRGFYLKKCFTKKILDFFVKQQAD